ncbi:sodium-dependent phosphate transporter 1-B-like [Cyclospora cayetanensis]|uniref:Sodium-dependent phosphate transporter 1-B-like n=1 Tax=Cyclospora cayetanensis TaxID=88456 RepID=A0A6P6RZ71_9EIME|nr:sodium-dependent phosphate transporter 1-B-like [Cyclospora cayetanensis]
MALRPELLQGMSGAPQDFLWIVVVGGIVCFLTAFAIGANDVANTFSSSVGSKAIPLSTAIAMAAALETLGATLLGAAVTDSIRSKIIDFSAFEEHPSVLMLGMLCSLLGAGLWLYLANRFGLPVSTTHSIVGALLGFEQFGEKLTGTDSAWSGGKRGRGERGEKREEGRVGAGEKRGSLGEGRRGFPKTGGDFASVAFGEGGREGGGGVKAICSQRCMLLHAAAAFGMRFCLDVYGSLFGLLY